MIKVREIMFYPLHKYIFFLSNSEMFSNILKVIKVVSVTCANAKQGIKYKFPIGKLFLILRFFATECKNIDNHVRD